SLTVGLLPRSPARAEVYANVVGSRVHHIDRNASIRQGLNGCRRKESCQVPAKRQDDRVAEPSEAAIPNQLLASHVVTLRIGISFHEANSVGRSGRERATQISNHDLAVIFDCLADGKLALGGLLAVDDLPFQFFTSVEIDAVRIGDMTAGPDDVEIIFLSDRKSTRLNSSHVAISYAVFCLKKKKKKK